MKRVSISWITGIWKKKRKKKKDSQVGRGRQAVMSHDRLLIDLSGTCVMQV